MQFSTEHAILVEHPLSRSMICSKKTVSVQLDSSHMDCFSSNDEEKDEEVVTAKTLCEEQNRKQIQRRTSAGGPGSPTKSSVLYRAILSLLYIRRNIRRCSTAVSLVLMEV